MATGFSKSVLTGSEEGIDTCCTLCFEDGISTEAEKYCMDCRMYYCKKCLKSHGRIPTLTGHRIVENSGPEAIVARTDLPTERCVTHHGELMDMFCEDHDAVCCSACVATEHRACVTVHYLPDIAGGAKESKELTDTKLNLTLLLANVKREKTRRLRNISNLKRDQKKISHMIDALEENLVEKIRKLANKCREALESIHVSERKIIEDDIAVLDETVKNLTPKLKQIDNGNNSQVFVNVKTGKKAITNTKTLLFGMSESGKRKHLTFIPRQDQELFDHSSESLGSINIRIEETEEDKMIRKYSATLSGKYRVNDVSGIVTSICVLDDGSLLLTVFDQSDKGLFSNCRLKRVDMYEFKVVDELKLKSNSYSVCSVGCQEAAVALFIERKIQFVSVAGRMTLTRSFKTDHDCYGLAFNAASAELLVTDISKQVKIYNVKGNIVKTYLNDNTGTPLFQNVRNVAFSTDNTLIVADGIKGLMAINTSSFVQWTITDIELDAAHGLCVLPGNVILVSGTFSNNVIQVDIHGKTIGILLGSGEKMDNPQALAYDRETSSLIVGQRTNEIIVYVLTHE